MGPATFIADAMILFFLGVDIWLRWKVRITPKDLEDARSKGYAEGYEDHKTDHYP